MNGLRGLHLQMDIVCEYQKLLQYFFLLNVCEDSIVLCVADAIRVVIQTDLIDSGVYIKKKKRKKDFHIQCVGFRQTYYNIKCNIHNYVLFCDMFSP